MLKDNIHSNSIMSLEQTYTCVPGQVFACMSVVGPDCPQKSDKFGLKIYGSFSTRDEAANYAKRLQKEDATFDIYVVDMNKWLLIPPDRDHIEDTITMTISSRRLCPSIARIRHSEPRCLRSARGT